MATSRDSGRTRRLVVHRGRNVAPRKTSVTGYSPAVSLVLGRNLSPSSALVVKLDMLEKSRRKGDDTRERILTVAESSVLSKGFSATSIEEIIAEVGITKGGFFYHFKNKGELAKGLLLRYLEQDKLLLDEIFRRGDELHTDPLHGFLVSLKLFAEMMANLPQTHPGCLAASFAYQDQLFNREIRKLNADGVMAWRKRFRAKIEAISKLYPPKQKLDVDALADMAATLVEGGLIVGRLLQDSTVLSRQILLYRDYIQIVFENRS